MVVISGAPGYPSAPRAGDCTTCRVRSTRSRGIREITCDQALEDPARAAAEIARVLRSAQEFSLPVYIELPRDLVGAEIGAGGRLAAPPGRPGRAGQCAEEICPGCAPRSGRW